ncbi:MAG: YihY/virulence factor BrkB family protein, partial [Actinomycetota bacterium]
PPVRPRRSPARGARLLGGLAAAVFRRVFAHNVTGRASQFAYSAFLATVPFFFVLVSTVGLIAGPDFYDDLIRDFRDEIPNSFEGLLESVFDTAARNTRTAVIGLVIGVVGGVVVVSNVMVTLMGALDNAYGVRHRPWLRGRITALALALGESVLAMLTTAALVGGPDLVRGLAELVGVDGGTPVRLAQRGVFLLGLVSLVVLTLILYRFGPNTRVHRFSEILPGAVVAVAAWVGTTRAFRVFVDNFDQYTNVYGALASIVVYLWYLYVSGIVLLVGAELNGELAKRRAVRDALHPRPPQPAAPTPDDAADTRPLGAPPVPAVRAGDTEVLPPPEGAGEGDTTRVIDRPDAGPVR